MRERRAGESKGVLDTYYFSPKGKMFRSMKDVDKEIGKKDKKEE